MHNKKSHGEPCTKEIKEIHAHSLRTSSLSLHLPLLLHKLLLTSSPPNLPYSISLLLNTCIPLPLPLPTPLTFLLNHLLRLSSRHSPAFSPTLRLFALLPRPNPHSFTFLLSACATHRRPLAGRSLHSLLLKLGHPLDPFTATSLLSLYSKTGLLSDARRLFDEMPLPHDPPPWNSLISGYTQAGDMATALQLFERMPVRNVVSWTSVIAGYAQNEMWEEAVGLFLRMWRQEGCEARPNAVTVASVLPACAGLGALGLGTTVEEYARREGFVGNVFVGNALVEMYGKCGSLENAWRVFEEMGKRRNLCTWNSMIMALAVHGRAGEALRLFHEMRAEGFTPDDITFVGLLLACTHGGLVDQGKNFFKSMDSDFMIRPKLQHYGCMVDLLGRSGFLNEAYELIKGMPMEPDSVIWGALLGACSFHGEVKLAETAAKFLVKLEPENPGNGVILSNIYASSGQWKSVAEVWKLKKGKQQRKSAGYSAIEFDGIMHKFFVEDKSHPRSEDIYLVLREMIFAMKGEEDFFSSCLSDT